MTTVYRIEKNSRADLWPSQGALFSEGRWNRRGFWVIYTSESVSLAKLETLANAKSLPVGRILLEIEIATNAPVVELKLAELPQNWMDIPYPTTLHQLTEELLAPGKSVALKVPSRQSPGEFNYLLYPLHPEFSKFIGLKGMFAIDFDHRLK